VNPGARVSAVYDGAVFHARATAPRHEFRRPAWLLYLDVDELPGLRRDVALLGHGRARPLEFRDGDHFRGHRRERIRARVARMLRTAGLPPPQGPVRVLTMPRVLGQGFNPVSFWWCHDGRGGLLAGIAEVHNTFGDRHAYVLPGAEAERTATGWRWTTRKRMHVSPFFDLAGSYTFELGDPGPTLRIGADLTAGGELRMRAWLEARRRPLTDGSILRAAWRRPLMPWIVWTSIHARAWRVWRLGARYHPRPRYDPALPDRELP
jgi:DUF1365 family protein